VPAGGTPDTMRIGLLTTSFPRSEHDIAGAFVLGFARALAAHGHEIEVLAPEPRECVPAPAWPQVDVRWVPYMRPRSLARTFYGAGVPDNLRRDPLAWLGLAPFAGSLLRGALARRSRWDAVISHWALPCGLVASAVREARPHLCVMHSADLHLLSRLPWRRAIATQLARTSSSLIFVSDAHRELFAGMLEGDARTLRELRARCHVQAMGIDADFGSRVSISAIDRAEARRQLGIERFALLTIARLVPVKGMVEAVRALADRSDLEWLIAGDGPERARLEAIAVRANLRVRVLGEVTGDAKHTLLRAADAFVLPSRVLASGRSEGAPTVLLEAMAHDLPVIASDVGGVGEFVSHMHSGMLFDPCVPGALAACVDRLRFDRASSDALVARGRVVADRHRWNRIAPQFDGMLRRGDSTPSRGARRDVVPSR
jgi:glycosyltransferase involved in cell wall biosynthesis